MNNPRKKAASHQRAIRFSVLSETSVAIYAHLAAATGPVEEDALIADVGAMIPPAHAYRHMASQAEKKGQTLGDDDYPMIVARGQRRMVQQALRAIERNGNAVRDHGKIVLAPTARAAYLAWQG